MNIAVLIKALYKYKLFLFFAIVLISAVIYHNIWVSGKMDKAVDAYKAKISVATNQQVIKDVKSIEATFANPASAIHARAARWVQHESEQASGSDKLRGIQSDTATSRAKGGSQKTINIRGQPLLLDSEVDFIQKHSELLQ